MPIKKITRPDQIKALRQDGHSPYSASLIFVRDYQGALTDENGDDCRAHIAFLAALALDLSGFWAMRLGAVADLVGHVFNEEAARLDKENDPDAQPLILDVSIPMLVCEAEKLARQGATV